LIGDAALVMLFVLAQSADVLVGVVT